MKTIHIYIWVYIKTRKLYDFMLGNIMNNIINNIMKNNRISYLII